DLDPFVVKGGDYVVNLIGDPGFQLVSPAVRFGHDALHMVLNIWALPMPDLRQTGDCEARDADAPHGPDACTERSGGCVIPADRQAAGIVLREVGDVYAGVRELRDALRLARRTGSTGREADVLASLGVALVYAGRTADGLAAFDLAVQQSSGVLAGRVMVRRGMALWTLGRYAAALDDLRRAVSV